MNSLNEDSLRRRGEDGEGRFVGPGEKEQEDERTRGKGGRNERLGRAD